MDQGSALAEALAAIDGAVIAGLEGNLAGLAALGAHGVEHLTAFAGGLATALLTGVTAGLAALGLILEAVLSVELLLAG